MSLTLSRARQLRRRLLADGRQEEAELHLERLQNLTRDLDGPVDGLDRLMKCCEILEIPTDSGLRQRLASTLHTLRDLLRSSPEAIGQGTEFNDFKRSLVNYNASLREAAEAGWSQRKLEISEEVPDGMLSFWEAIPNLRAEVAKVRRLLEQVNRRGDVLSDPGRLRQLASDCTEIRLITSGLYSSFDAPPQVQEFIKSTRMSGARWRQLTDEVQDWLEEHNLLDSLRIRLD